ncbi:MAG: SRPBCC domain-containing protein [Gammaproteobacteria bacterium]|nr:SRPBCC domain-containing protein [Gammaproteobacteria bacterium]
MTETREAPYLRIVRQFGVSPDVVFNAFTKPESMRVWWGENTEFDINLSVGGRWTITRKEGKTIYTATGEYLEIEPPHRLRYTYAMPQFSPNSDTISIEITPEGAGCVVTFVQSGEDIASELRELSLGSTSASEEGWQQGFNLMTIAWEASA